MRTFVRFIGLSATLVLIVALAACAKLDSAQIPAASQLQPQTVTSTMVSVGSPASPFAQNKQNEPAVAIDPNNPDVMVAGSNDEIDLEACAAGDPTTCPFTPGVGVSGFYASLDGGATWTQPSYTGESARSCLGPDACATTSGPIGTLPHYDAAGLVSDGDPTLAFGPKPDDNGNFSWANGSRLYYGNLTSNLNGGGNETFKGFEAIAVSRTDDVAGAASGDASAWMDPVIVSKQNAALFSDKEALWVDNAATSPYFGHAYVCNVAFRGAVSSSRFAAPEPVLFARSTDGGDSWTARQISSAANTGLGQGRQGCAIRTDSQGGIYVFFESAANMKSTPPVFDQAILMARSTDGGQTFERARPIAPVTECGQYDPAFGDVFFDGVAGARTDSFPSVDIANGAPDGTNPTDTIVVTWCGASQGLNHEQALVTLSTDGGATWSTPVNAAASGDRPDFPSVAISPDGSDLYLVYMGFTDPYRYNTTDTRTMQGVVRHVSVSDVTDPTAWTTLHRGAPGDARASSANSLAVEFLGDYTYVAATRSGATAVWTDAPADGVCDAVNAYRAFLGPRPAVGNSVAEGGCGVDNTFGNTDIVSFTAQTTP